MNNKAISTKTISVRTRMSSIIFGILPSLLLIYGLFAFFSTDQLTLAVTDNKEIPANVEINVRDDIEISEIDMPSVASEQSQLKINAALQDSTLIIEPVPWPPLPNGYRYVKELPSQVVDNTVNGFLGCSTNTIIDCNGEVTGSDETIHGDIEYTGSFTVGVTLHIRLNYGQKRA